MRELIREEQTIQERYLRQVLVRDQMSEFVKASFITTKADGVHNQDSVDVLYPAENAPCNPISHSGGVPCPVAPAVASSNSRPLSAWA